MKFITVKEFADMCNKSDQAIRNRIKSGSIIPENTDPITIDAGKYLYLIEYLKKKKYNK